MIQSQNFPKVDQFIADGQLGRARDRLHGLHSAQPDNLAIRRRLGKVYSLLGYPEMAGRYWYLEAEKSAEMQAACAEFERSCGGDPLRILQQLKFRGHIEKLEDAYAQETILRLLDQIKTRHGIIYHLRPKGEGGVRYERMGRDGWVILGCIGLAFALLIILAIVGLLAVVRFLF